MEGLVYPVGDHRRIERGGECDDREANNSAGSRRVLAGVAGAGVIARKAGESTPVCDHPSHPRTITSAVDTTGELKHGRQEYIY